MKETPLREIHEAQNAKMVPFAGYEMPLKYSSISEEHLAVRRKAGLFDVSHMGEFIIKGREALSLIQTVISNDISDLEIGQARYTCMLDEGGGIIDDLLVYRLPEDQCSEGENAFMLVVNAANTEGDLKWINEQNNFDTKVIDISEQTGLLALQGPAAAEILAPWTDMAVSDIPFYRFEKGTVAEQKQIIVSATGYTGAGGFELYGRNEQIKLLWKAMMDSGEKIGLKPAGLGARDTLRLEMGFCLHGQDITPETHPFEAGLSWTVKMNKEEFIGKKALMDIKKEGWSHRLKGVELKGRRVPRQGYEIVNDKKEKIGWITSGSQSPSLKKPIGLGYVEKSAAEDGKTIGIRMGTSVKEAKIVSPPFLK